MTEMVNLDFLLSDDEMYVSVSSLVKGFENSHEDVDIIQTVKNLCNVTFLHHEGIPLSNDYTVTEKKENSREK